MESMDAEERARMEMESHVDQSQVLSTEPAEQPISQTTEEPKPSTQSQSQTQPEPKVCRLDYQHMQPKINIRKY